MPGMLTAGLRAPADVITGWVIALLALTAAILVAVGLVRAWLGRRRPQVVIHDVELDHGVPPEAAAGLAVALDLALPSQRGWSVRTFPTIHGSGADAKVGLSVEVARLGRAPDAVTTFSRTSGALQRPASDAARVAAMGELLHELLR